jgi:beta-lactamase class C
MLSPSFKSALLIFSLLLLPATGNTQTPLKDPKVENAVKNFLHRFSVPGAAVLIYRDGKLEQYVFGYSDSHKKTPVTTKTLFELGSVTKTFTGLLLAQQVRAGHIKFNDEWKNFLPQDQYSSSTDRITLLGLATYTASLPKDVRGLPYNAAGTAEHQKNLAHFLQTWTAPYPAGSHMLYSNLSFSLLGMALAQKQDKSLAQLMQQDIFTPLKMPSATLTVAKGDKNYDRYAQGYDAQGKPARTPVGGLLSSSWALKASLQDMASYLKAAVGDPEVSPALVASMRLAQTGYFQLPTTKNSMQVGLGWFIIPYEKLSKNDFIWDASRRPAPRPVEAIAAPQFNGNSLIDKTGATNGFRAYIGVIPDQHIGVVVLTNKFIYHGGAVRDLGRALLINMTPLAGQL